MSDTKSFPLTNVEIHLSRGKDTLTVAVPEHEINVLRAIHGDANVQLQGQSDDEVELSDSSAAEYARLQRKYRQPGSSDPVRYAFPQGARDIAGWGFDGHGAAGETVQSSQRTHKKPKAVKKKAAK